MKLLKELKNETFVEIIQKEKKNYPTIFQNLGEEYDNIFQREKSLLELLDILTGHLISEAVTFFIEKEYGLHSDSYFNTPIKLNKCSEMLLQKYISNTLSITKNIYKVNDFDKREEYSDGEYRKTIDDVLEILDSNINLYLNKLEVLNQSIQTQYFKGKNYMKKFILDKITSTTSEYMKQYINNNKVNDVIDDHMYMVLLTY